MTPQGLTPAFEWWRPSVRLAPVVGLLDGSSLLIEADHRRAGERDLLAVLADYGPPLDRGAVACDDRFAHPDLRLALLAAERPPGVLDRAAGLAERMRAMHRFRCVDRSEQVGIERAPGPRPRFDPRTGRGFGIHRMPNFNPVLTES